MTKFRVRVGNQSVSESPYNPYLESQSIHHKKKLSAATLHFVPPQSHYSDVFYLSTDLNRLS